MRGVDPDEDDVDVGGEGGESVADTSTSRVSRSTRTSSAMRLAVEVSHGNARSVCQNVTEASELKSKYLPCVSLLYSLVA